MSHGSFKKTFILLTAISATALVSCKKDEEKAASTGAAPKIEEALGKLASPSEVTTVPLYTSLPKDVAAFFSVNLQGAAFDRLLTSKWGKSYLSKTSAITAQMPDLAAVMTEAGMDMSKPEDLKKQLSEVLILLASTEPAPNGHGALILKSPSEAKTQTLFNALSEAAKKRGGTSTPGEFTMVATVSQNNMPAADGLQQVKKVNMTGKLAGDKIVIADDAELIKKLAAPQDKFASTELAAAASAAGANSIGIGFLDFQKLKASSNDGEQLPVKVGIFSAQMSDHPTVQVKLVKEKISAVTPTAATSKIILSSIPNDPLLYTVLEAGAIRDLATQSSPQAEQAMNDTQFAFVKSIGQIGIGAKVAADAQAMMPIPEVIVSVQTTDTKGLMDTMMQSASGAVKGYGLPGATTEKQIGGKSVKVLQGAMGVNLYAADLGGAVVAATTESLIAAAIERSSGKGVASNISAQSTAELTKPGVAKLYLSFPELAKLLKSAQSMAGLAGGAPGQPNPMAAALSDENLKTLEDLGSLMGSVASDNESYNVNISYN